jgi:hypothetical protein
MSAANAAPDSRAAPARPDNKNALIMESSQQPAPRVARLCSDAAELATAWVGCPAVWTAPLPLLALAVLPPHPLHTADHTNRVNGGFTRIRHPGTVEDEEIFKAMTARRTIRAIVPGAGIAVRRTASLRAPMARPDAALILGGLLLLISP